MFKRKKNAKPDAVQEALDRAYTELSQLMPHTKEYADTLSQVTELEKLVAAKAHPERYFKPDTLLMVGANLLGILLILNFEKADAVTSKALGFVSKTRT